MNKINKKYLFVIMILASLLLVGGVFLLAYNLKSDSNTEYVITFDANGGSFEDGTNVSTLTNPEGLLIYSCPMAMREGYQLLGWSQYEKDLSYYSTSSIYRDFTITNDITLYAQWDFEFTVRYHTDITNPWQNLEEKTFYYISNDYIFPSHDFMHYLITSHRNPNIRLVGWSEDPNSSIATHKVVEEMEELNVYPNAVIDLYPVWEDTYLNYYSVPKGSGTIDDPYLISKDTELAWISYGVENYSYGYFDNCYFKQTANIDLSAHKWVPIGGGILFNGHYDGNGYVISNLNISYYPMEYYIASDGTEASYTRTNVGLFGYVNNGSVSNVTITSGEIIGIAGGNNAYVNVGAIAGHIFDAEIINCVNFSTLKVYSCKDEQGYACYVGGIVGGIPDFSNRNPFSRIEGCANYGKIVSSVETGGIIGYNLYSQNEIKKCIVDCEIKICRSTYDDVEVGGIFGSAWGGNKNLAYGIENCVVSINLNTRDGSYYTKYSSNLFGGTFGNDFYGFNTTILKNCSINLQTNNIDFTWIGKSKETRIEHAVLYQINDRKCYMGSYSSFYDWGVLPDGRFVPKALFWSAQFSPEVTTDHLLEKGYVYITDF